MKDDTPTATEAAAQGREIDLENFCGYGLVPFSRGPWTYSTNGIVMVRVVRRDDVAENDDAPDVEVLFEQHATTADYKPAPRFEFTPCEHCDGDGRCPECGEGECFNCKGTGLESSKIEIDDVPFDAEYLELLQDRLPELEFATAYPAKPLAFRFSGGAGLIMPLAKKKRPPTDT